LLTGCGAGARGSTVPRPEDGANGASVYALLPPDTTELFYVDLASMKRPRSDW